MQARADCLIRPLGGAKEAERCARMMEASEPWLTLGYRYEAGLALLSDDTRERHVAITGDRIAGFVVLVLRGSLVGYLQTICVAPEWRGHGIGRLLMEFSETLVFARHPNLFLTVSDFNVAAREFYRSLGYEIVGELRDYIVAGRSEILMRKSRGPLRGYSLG